MVTSLLNDDLIEQEISRRVRSAVGAAVGDLRVVVVEGRARLSGQVDSYAVKRRVAELAGATGGIRHVINQLRIVPPPS